MNIEKVGPSQTPQQRGGSTSATRKFQEEMEKVEKVGEVDPDQQSRGRKNQRTEQEGIDKKEIPNVPSSLLGPSTFKNKSFDNIKDAAIASPGYTLSPDLILNAPPSEETSDDDLPDPKEGLFASFQPVPFETAKSQLRDNAVEEEEKKKQQPVIHLEDEESDEAGEKKKGKSDLGESTRTLKTNLSPVLMQEIASLTKVASTQASPFLNPETILLFEQMVGTILILRSSRDVTQTEVLLNSAAFKGSRFYGAKIVIERHETAANSLNIRLTGSAEAVQIFQHYLPSLMAAFQNSQFPFRIGRMEAFHEEVKSSRVKRKRQKGNEEEEW